MKTTAQKKGDYYFISRVKNWVTSGINSDYIILFAVTEHGVGHKGISCFIVEKGWDGFETGKPETNWEFVLQILVNYILIV